MKLLLHFEEESEAQFECSNNHQFWVDASSWENLYCYPGTNGELLLMAECPYCGEQEVPKETT